MSAKGRIRSLTAALEKRRAKVEEKLPDLIGNDSLVSKLMDKLLVFAEAKGYKSDDLVDALYDGIINDKELVRVFSDLNNRVEELRKQIR